MPDRIRRLLVTGSQEDLIAFHLALFPAVNAVEVRGDTVLYSCLGERYDAALAVARGTGLTVQIHTPDRTGWQVVVQGKLPGWEKR